MNENVTNPKMQPQLVLPKSPKHDAARDTLLEVWLASRLERAGFSARVQEPDIGLEVQGTEVGVA